jgi:hypothetical protein
MRPGGGYADVIRRRQMGGREKQLGTQASGLPVEYWQRKAATDGGFAQSLRASLAAHAQKDPKFAAALMMQPPGGNARQEDMLRAVQNDPAAMDTVRRNMQARGAFSGPAPAPTYGGSFDPMGPGYGGGGGPMGPGSPFGGSYGGVMPHPTMGGGPTYGGSFDPMGPGIPQGPSSLPGSGPMGPGFNPNMGGYPLPDYPGASLFREQFGSAPRTPGEAIRRLSRFTPQSYANQLPSQRGMRESLFSALGLPPEDAWASIEAGMPTGPDPSRALYAGF